MYSAVLSQQGGYQLHRRFDVSVDRGRHRAEAVINALQKQRRISLVTDDGSAHGIIVDSDDTDGIRAAFNAPFVVKMTQTPVRPRPKFACIEQPREK